MNGKTSIIAAAILLLIFALKADLSEAKNETISITANFSEKECAPNERIELKLSRVLTAEDGRIGVFIGETDISSLLTLENETVAYEPRFFPFPAGESPVAVYLIEPGGEWKKLAEFTLKVKSEIAESSGEPNLNSTEDSFEFTPNLSINIKGQNQTLTFPRESAPERNPFTDVGGQGNFGFKVTRRGWNFSSQMDFVGASFQPEALRFGELANKAPQIDLSSYLIEFGKGRFKVNLGHVSFGSNRHLVSSFSSRGISATIPLGKQNEVILSAANGTSIVGYDNFIGITRRKHSVMSATFAREFFKERAGGLRVEVSVLRGSLLPLSDFNQGEINDAEKSLGFGFRVVGSDKKQRLRYEAGFTRSRFTNPRDPNLEQGFNVTEIRESSKNARYGEISFDFLQGLKVWNEKKLKLTGTFRYEEIAPLFRSIGASTQADRRQNQFEVSGNFGELNFAFGNLRDRDNLNDIASILKTLNRRNNVIIGVALGSFFTPAKPKK